MASPKGRWAATAPENIKSEDLSMKIIVLVQIKTILYISSNVFSSYESVSNSLLNLKNSLSALHRTLEGSIDEKEREGRTNYEKWLTGHLKYVNASDIMKKTKFFDVCMDWYFHTVTKLDH